MIALEKVHYGYDKKMVLDELSFSIEKGRITTLFGPSGCGKSTVLKIIAGLLKPQSGDVYIDGESCVNRLPEKRQVGFVFQKPLLFPHMTVADNIGFSMAVEEKKHRLSHKSIEETVNHWLSVFQIEALARRYPEELSGGQAQRVAVARAIASNPRLLLMDEPFSALDIRARQEMNDWLRYIQKELGLTVLFVTHDVDECLRLSEEVILMDEAGIVQQGSPDHVYYYPESERAARLMGAYNVMDDVLAKQWQLKPGSIIRPDMLALEEAKEGLWRCQFAKTQGMTKRYKVSDGEHQLLVDSLGERRLEEGGRCHVYVNSIKRYDKG